MKPLRFCNPRLNDDLCHGRITGGRRGLMYRGGNPPDSQPMTDREQEILGLNVEAVRAWRLKLLWQSTPIDPWPKPAREYFDWRLQHQRDRALEWLSERRRAVIVSNNVIPFRHRSLACVRMN